MSIFSDGDRKKYNNNTHLEENAIKIIISFLYYLLCVGY
jgi:hypothetical protein